MSKHTDIGEQQKPSGELFARVYIERGAPMQDNQLFRNRVEAYLQKNHYKDYSDLSSYLKQEAGLVVASVYSATYKSLYYNFQDFFAKNRIEYVLSAITLIWRYLVAKYPESKRNPTSKTLQYITSYPAADAWLAFVRRALREENMAYTLDARCGAHFLVDEEFERNRVSALQCLESSRYSGARAAFEAAHSYLDLHPADTKASVRSAFEALEIVARLIDTQSKNLNKWMVENKLKPLAQSLAQDDVERQTIDSLFDGIARFVDGLHNYRHGQGTQQPIAPSLTMAVYVLSSVAATLRWLVLIDDDAHRANP